MMTLTWLIHARKRQDQNHKLSSGTWFRLLNPTGTKITRRWFYRESSALVQRTGRERVRRRIEQARTHSWTGSRSQIPHYLDRWCEDLDCHQPPFGWITNDCLGTAFIVLHRRWRHETGVLRQACCKHHALFSRIRPITKTQIWHQLTITVPGISSRFTVFTPDTTWVVTAALTTDGCIS
jgi:hypothetical protein